MDRKEIREQILKEFIKNIATLSDEEYQERVWVRNEGAECDDMDDAIVDFFDDGQPIFEKFKEYGITDVQFEALMKLNNKLRLFADVNHVYHPNKSTAKLIKMPEWSEIRKLAKNVILVLNAK